MTTDQVAEERPSARPAEQSQADIRAGHTKVTELEQQARALIRQRPVVAVLAAAGVGYLVARLVSRGTRWAQ